MNEIEAYLTKTLLEDCKAEAKRFLQSPVNQQPIPMPYEHAINQLTAVAITFNSTAETESAPVNKAGLKAVARDIDDAISLLKVGQFGGLLAVVSLVRQWGIDKGITGPNAKATVQTQFDKLLEEVHEINDGIKSNDQHAIIDGIGDSTVVLILLAELAGVKFETCLLAAWDVIKDRQGTIINGQFVKSNEPTSKSH